MVLKTLDASPSQALRLAAIASAVVLVHAALLARVELPRPGAPIAATPSPHAVVALRRLSVEPAQAASVGAAPAAAEPAPHEPVVARLPRPHARAFEARPLLIKAAFQPDAAIVTEPRRPAHDGEADASDEATQVFAQAALPKPSPASPAAAPTYRTKPPAAATLAYRLTRGPIVGSGAITWQPEAGSYRLQLEGSVPIVGTLITQTSRGRLDATGLAPERFTDRRLRRGEQAANFDRAAGRIGFSGQQPDVPFTPGVQDRVSVMVQLAAIANAWTRTPPVGDVLQLRVVGARGDAHLWSMRFEGPQAVETPDGRVAALRFLREPESEHDTRAEFWLDPGRQFLPVKVVLTDDKGESLELLRIR